MDALEAMRQRRSVRQYLPTPLDKETLEQIVNCGRMAATARNDQPWEFVAVTDAALRRQIAGIASYGKFIADAPVCVAVLCLKTDYYLEDGCAATQNMLVAAHALGLGSCWVAGHGKPYANDILRLLGAPEGHALVSLIALGHAAQTGSPKKRPLDEVLHWEKY